MASQQELRHRPQAIPTGFSDPHPPIIHLTRSDSSSSLSSSSVSSSDQDRSSIPIFELPQFTIKELLGSIPSHCFERSLLKSSKYLIWDLFLSFCLIYSFTKIDQHLDSNLNSYLDPYLSHGSSPSIDSIKSISRLAIWSLYAYTIGLVWTGIWVIAHECGHQSFSTSKKINNTVGWILHSALLVPYHSWRISHAQHHAATAHLTRDQVFVPKTRSQRGLPPLPPDATKHEREGTLTPSMYEKMDNILEDAPFWNFLNLLAQQLVGWPAYLFVNASGQSRYPPGTNHFNPQSIMFDSRHRQQVLISDLGIGIMLALLGFIGYRTSFLTVLKYYVAPYLWVNHWLVMITYLQHTDPTLPHYRDGAFNFQRGALCTMDRNLHGFFFHGISETHVVHHLCSKIPHYHAWDATRALKAKLGSHYHHSDENPWKSLWKCYNECRFVEDEGDVVFFKNSKGQAAIRLGSPTSKGSVSDSGVDVNDATS